MSGTGPSESTEVETPDARLEDDRTFDAIVVGAGITGLHQLYRLQEAGLKVRLLDAGSGVGGVWYWNRYPGARFDAESYSYGYFFSEELRNEWTWTEEYAGQPEIERYLNFAADRLGLRPNIQLNTRVASATFDENEHVWIVTTEAGEVFRTTFFITAVGILSAPQFPRTPGLDQYSGEWYHTALWPKEEVSFAGKRVAVIGTGSSGVQIIPFVAEDAEHLFVFQRTPNWVTPINNFAITAERMAEIRATSEAIYQACLTSPSGSPHSPMNMLSTDVTPEERDAQFERLYQAPGLTMALGNFRDISRNQSANASLNAFLANKIRSRVNDPEVAEKLIPTDHGFGQKRPPLENGYFEVFNQPNVTLVSTVDEPMTSFTEKGIQTTEQEYELDMIVFATGFEAVTGSITRMNITGKGGQPLDEYWLDGPRTYLGLQSANFPNLFYVGGPQSAAGTIPRITETQVDWVTECILYVLENGYSEVTTTTAAEDEWNDHVNEGIKGTLQETASSWAFGSNVEGRRRAYLLYNGGQPQYRQKIAEAKDAGYAGFVFNK
ncbi:MAG: cyclohexanone monooxygenase [Subtercola sp.]|nr:cyclohexanone monooxygenase [Subtercola sp.]